MWPATGRMQVVVLLGGLGTRLGAAGQGLPKSMADVHGKPFLHYQVDLMKEAGFSDFLLCAGHKAGEVESIFGDGRSLGVRITYSYDGEKLLGTGGALRKALPLAADDFLLIYGDSYMDVDYGELIYYYNKAKLDDRKKMLMAVFRNRGRFDRSNVVFTSGRLLSYDKMNPSPKAEYIDYGVSVIDRTVLNRISENTESDIADLFRDLVREGLAAGHEVRNRFYEIGTPSSLEEFRAFMHQRAYVRNRAIVLDRDGTLNEMVPNGLTGEPDSPMKAGELRLFPKTADALKILRSLGYLLVVVTNQPAAAKGKTTLGDLYEVNSRLHDVLAEEGVRLDDLLMCPHHPEGAPDSKEPSLITRCGCRKPEPGLLLSAARKFNIDAELSYSVGDRPVDVEAGRAAGMKTALLKKGGEFESLYDFALHLKNTERKS